MLWAPSWGGMLNGLLTLRGAWHKLREDPVLKFFAAGVTFYGMATFEGPLLSIKIGQRAGALHRLDHRPRPRAARWAGTASWRRGCSTGWCRGSTARSCTRRRAADLHFWLGTVGILLYVVAMWVSGVTQGLMWRATNPDGTLLYPNFVETVLAIRPMYIVRARRRLACTSSGFVMMAWNLLRRRRAPAAPSTARRRSWSRTPARSRSRASWRGASARAAALVLAGRAGRVALLGLVQPMRAVVIIGVRRRCWASWPDPGATREARQAVAGSRSSRDGRYLHGADAGRGPRSAAWPSCCPRLVKQAVPAHGATRSSRTRRSSSRAATSTSARAATPATRR